MSAMVAKDQEPLTHYQYFFWNSSGFNLRNIYIFLKYQHMIIFCVNFESHLDISLVL